MSMFDYLRCRMPGPDPDAIYQTKSLDCDMDMIEIAEDGAVSVNLVPQPGLRCEIRFGEWSAFVTGGRVIDLARVQ